MRSAFKTDAQGKYAYQDPDEDLDWSFDFADPDAPQLLTGEDIASIDEMILRRDDSVAVAGTELHNQGIDGGRAGVFVRNLLPGITYWLECSITTTAVPPRKYSRSFRLVCRER